MDGQVPKEVVPERYDRLVGPVEEIAWAENRKLVGSTVEVLVAVGEGRKDAATGRMSGGPATGGCVHFTGNPESGQGTSCTPPSRTPRRTTSTPMARSCTHRRTRAGNLHEAPRARGVLLGMPKVGAPLIAAPAFFG